MALYTIRDIKDDTWKKFQALCALQGETAASKLRAYIKAESDKLDKMLKK